MSIFLFISTNLVLSSERVVYTYITSSDFKHRMWSHLHVW